MTTTHKYSVSENKDNKQAKEFMLLKDGQQVVCHKVAPMVSQVQDTLGRLGVQVQRLSCSTLCGRANICTELGDTFYEQTCETIPAQFKVEMPVAETAKIIGANNTIEFPKQ